MKCEMFNLYFNRVLKQDILGFYPFSSSVFSFLKFSLDALRGEYKNIYTKTKQKIKR